MRFKPGDIVYTDTVSGRGFAEILSNTKWRQVDFPWYREKNGTIRDHNGYWSEHWKLCETSIVERILKNYE